MLSKVYGNIVEDTLYDVLILVLMEYALEEIQVSGLCAIGLVVLILVLMEYALEVTNTFFFVVEQAVS